MGGFILFLYGIVPTFQPFNFGRVYAVYDEIFVAMTIIWGLWIDKKDQLDMKSYADLLFY